MIAPARAHRVNVAPGLARARGAAQRREQGHALALQEREHRGRGRGPGVGEEREHLEFLHQAARVGQRTRRVTRIVERGELDAPPVHAARVVQLAQVGQRAGADLLAERLLRAGERCGLAEHDGARRDALGRGGQGVQAEAQSE